jgi:hypothetical protein
VRKAGVSVVLAVVAVGLMPATAHADAPYIGVSAGYEGLAMGPNTWANGLVGTLRLATADQWLSLTLLVDYRVGIFVDSLPNGLRIDDGAFRLMCGMRIVKRRPITVEGALGAGFDVMRVETRPDIGPVSMPTLPALRASVTERFRLWDRIDVAISAVLEIDPTGTTFSTDVAGQPITVFSPWPVRPGLMIELAAP